MFQNARIINGLLLFFALFLVSIFTIFGTPFLKVHAQTTGTISGYVFQNDGVTPISGAEIIVDPLTNTGWIGGVYADINGYFVFAGLSPGMYRVHAHANGYANEIYDEVLYYGDYYNGTPVAVVAGQDTPNIDFTLDPGGTISGTVYTLDTDGVTQIPLSDVGVDTAHSGGWGTCTDINGNYAFSGFPLDTEIYMRAGGSAGCAMGNYATEYWQEQTNSWDANPIILTSGGGEQRTDIDFTLDEGGTISGKITEEDGVTPIPGAEICVDTYDAYFHPSSCSGSSVNGDGTYTFNGLSSGTYRVWAKAPGFAHEHYDGVPYYGNENNATPVSVTLGQDTPNIDIMLDPGGSISGYVYDEGSLPLVEVPVDVWPGGFGNCTDVDGSFTIIGLPLDTDIIITAGGRSWGGCSTVDRIQEYWDNNPLSNWDANPIRLTAADPDATNKNFNLALGGTFSGTIFEADGVTPITGAFVFIDGTDGQWYGGFGIGSDDGTYTSSALPSGTYRVSAQSDGYAQEFFGGAPVYGNHDAATPVTVTVGQDTPNVDIMLDPGGTISGYVYDEGGLPLGDVRVESWPPAFGRCTDTDGSFTLPGFPLDTDIFITAGASRGWGGCSTVNRVQEYWDNQLNSWDANPIRLTTAEPDAINKNFNLVLGGTISGTVIDQATGLPVANMYVDGGGISACTNADGTYTIIGAPLGTPFQVNVGGSRNWCGGPINYVQEYWQETPHQYEADWITLTSASRDISGIDFTLEIGGTVSGTVVDQTTGLPIANECVAVNQYLGGNGMGSACTDANGAYTIGGISLDVPFHVSTMSGGSGLGNYVPEYWPETHNWSNATALTLTSAGLEITGIDFTLETGGTVSGTVVDQTTGLPIANVWINQHHPGDYDRGACTDANGAYIISGIPFDTPFQMNASSNNERCGGPDYVQEYWQETPNQNDATWITLISASPETSGIDFTLETGGTVSGVVIDQATGLPLTNMPVSVHMPGSGATTCTDSNGNYTLSHLPHDIPFRVSVSTSDGNNGCGGPSGYAEEFWQEGYYNTATLLTITHADPDIAGINFTPEIGIQVSGYVTDAVTGLPIPNMNVSVNEVDSAGVGRCTDGAGFYTALVPPNRDFVAFAAQSQNWCGGPSSYISEFWQEADGGSSATELTGLPGSSFNNINFTLEQGGTLSGTLTASENGTFLSNVWVCASDYHATHFDLGHGWACAPSDSNGVYAIEGVPPGEKRLWAFPQDRLQLFYSNSPSFAGATPVALAGIETIGGLDFAFPQAGTITGTVYAADGVTPLNRVTISTENGDYMQCSGADGSYSIFVPAGTHVIKAWEGPCDSDAVFPTQYYNLTSDPAQASPITITVGETVAGINFVVIGDSDNDGISDSIEDGAPNGGDGNSDGTPDSQQVNVTSLPNAIDGGYVTLVSPAGTQLVNVQALTNPSPGDAPAGVSFPIGFFSFEVQGLSVGGATDVTLILPAGVTVDTYYKHSSTPEDNTPHWYEFLYDTITGAQINPGEITLSFVDGARGDGDITANGIVADPGGPGVTVTVQPPTNLIATAVSSTQIDLTWTDNSDDETAFHIERSPDGTIWTEIGTVGAEIAEYLDNTPLSCSEFQYRVRAYRNSDDTYSEYSNTVSMSTSTTAASINGQLAFTSTRDGDHDIYLMDGNECHIQQLTNTSTNEGSPAWSPDGTKIAFGSDRDGNQELYVMNADGSNQIRLTNNALWDYEPAWSPDGTQILFSSNRDGNYDIYSMGVDGSNPINLSNNSAKDRHPSMSPDGTRIAFYSNRDGNFEIYLMNADGTDQTRLTNHSETDVHPFWSPDGTRILFWSTRDQGGELYVMNSDGSNVMRLTDNTADDAYPDWSPDATQIVFSSQRDNNYELYLMNADGSNQRRLTTTGTTAEFDPKWRPFGTPVNLSTTLVSQNQIDLNWQDNSADESAFHIERSPDGSTWTEIGTVGANVAFYADTTPMCGQTYVYRVRAAFGTTFSGYSAEATTRIEPDGGGQIVFQSDRDGDFDIYSMNKDGSNLCNLTDDATNDTWPAWSPDGANIVFSSDRDGDHEIYIINPDGSGVQQLTDNSHGDYNPKWSPDNSQIAFTSDRNGNQEIYLMNGDGTNQMKLTDHSAADRQPSWSPDGTQITFTSERNGEPEIYTMGASGANQTRLTDTVGINSGSAWSPDGSEIAFRSDRDGNPEIYVMASDGTNQTRITNNSTTDAYPGWSPDGTQIIFHSNRDGNYEIYVMDSGGTNQTRLTNSGATNFHPNWRPGSCYIDAPDAVFEGDAFTVTLRCVDLTDEVFGFQVGLDATGPVTSDDTSFTPGSFVTDAAPDILEVANTLDLYAVSRRTPALPVSGDFSIASVDYTANLGLLGDEVATLTLAPFILGDIQSNAIEGLLPVPSVEILIRDRLTVTGTVASEVAVETFNDVLVTLGGENYSVPSVPGNSVPFVFTDVFDSRVLDLALSARSHLPCTQTLVLTDSETDLGTIPLFAGEVTDDGDPLSAATIDLLDSTAIGLSIGGAGGPEDVNGDGAVDVLDLIHVGRNYNFVAGECGITLN